MKNQIDEETLLTVAAAKGVHFVNRSRGMATTETICLETLLAIVDACIKINWRAISD